MKIKRIKVKNYRSIKTEVSVDFDGEIIIIGPNNSGKTNFLKAIRLFFEALKTSEYQISTDLPFGLSGEQTSIVLSFAPTPLLDDSFIVKYQEVIGLLEGDKDVDGGLISLYLNFSSTGRPSYRFFTNDKVQPDKRDEYRRLHEELVVFFLDSFSCKYVPSEKSSGLLFTDFLLPHLKTYIGNLLQEHQVKVEEALSVVSSSISKNLVGAGLSGINCEFGLPGNLFSSALSSFDFFIDDGEKTPFYQKGSGIQAATILACFKWITAQETADGKRVVWLIEEPESYLHPGLTEACNKMLKDLSESSDVFVTTHAIGFIPQNHDKVLQSSAGKNKETSLGSLKGYFEATQSIRVALGVRFSDYYNLTEFNIFVEGKTDKALLQHVLNIVKPKGKVNQFQTLRKASVMDFSGVSSLKDFLKSTYSFMAKERAIVAIFDGDDAGVRAVGDLGHYFGNKDVPFNSNREYVVLPKRVPIEGLFPTSWLQELSDHQPKWMRIERDALGSIIDLNMPGNHKVDICNWLIKRSTDATVAANGVYEWAKDFLSIFKLVDDILEKKHASIISGR
ncbi:MAG: AAA family ATPase [Pseudomonadota bacterium]